MIFSIITAEILIKLINFVVYRFMGSFLEKPKTEKFVDSGTGNGLRYGMCSMQGWRSEMEDAHAAVTELEGSFHNWSYFGVFDGHAGSRVSELCASRLLAVSFYSYLFTNISLVYIKHRRIYAIERKY